MQQTETYKLNLIETSDPFSPQALNENTRKIEGAMVSHEAKVQAAMKAETSALEQRVAVLEAKKLAFGTYSGGVSLVQLGFTPKVVFVYERTTQSYAAGFLATYASDGHSMFKETGFEPPAGINESGRGYSYIALG